MATPRWRRERVAWARKNRRWLELLVPRRTPAELRALSRQAAVEELLAVAEAWGAVSGRNQDLSREGLEGESTRAVKAHLAWYCSDEARALIADHLVDLLRDLL